MGWLDDGKARMHDDGMTFAEAEIILKCWKNAESIPSVEGKPMFFELFKNVDGCV